MFIEGALSELVANVAPNTYRNYVIIISKGKPLLYVQKKKVLYGLLHSALLLYMKLVRDLDIYGFQINLYEPCVNKYDKK